MTNEDTTWTITVDMTVFAGDMHVDEVKAEAERLLNALLDGTDFTSFSVTEAKRDVLYRKEKALNGLEAHLQEAYKHGQNDTIIADALTDAGEQYIDNCIEEELSEEEKEQVIEAYTNGFLNL